MILGTGTRASKIQDGEDVDVLRSSGQESIQDDALITFYAVTNDQVIFWRISNWEYFRIAISWSWNQIAWTPCHGASKTISTLDWKNPLYFKKPGTCQLIWEEIVENSLIVSNRNQRIPETNLLSDSDLTPMYTNVSLGNVNKISFGDYAHTVHW